MIHIKELAKPKWNKITKIKKKKIKMTIYIYKFKQLNLTIIKQLQNPSNRDVCNIKKMRLRDQKNGKTQWGKYSYFI